MTYTPQFLEELKARFPLVQAIGQHVALKKTGREYEGLCPFHAEKSPSFKVNEEKSLWHCFGCGAHGNDFIAFEMQRLRVDFKEAVERLSQQTGMPPAAPQSRTPSTPRAAPVPIIPVPANTPPPPNTHPEFGTCTQRWAYRDAQGNVLSYDVRFDTPTGKQVLPQVYTTGRWRFKALPTKRPLFGLDQLAVHPEKAVMICEGCKATVAGTHLLTGYVGVSWSGGTNAINGTDWSPLKGRRLLLWPDRDRKKYPPSHPLAGEEIPYAEQLGTKAMEEIATILHPDCPNIKIVDVSSFEQDGFDLADWAEHVGAPHDAMGLIADEVARNDAATKLVAWTKDHISAWKPRSDAPKAKVESKVKRTSSAPSTPLPDPPPHTAEDIAAIKHAMRPNSEYADILPAPEFSDDSLAVRFANAHKDKLRFVRGWNKWMVWDKTVWLEDDRNHAQEMARQICRHASNEASTETVAKSITSARTIGAVERLASSDPQLTATMDQWDLDPWVLNTPTGLLNLRTNELLTNEPSQYCTRITSVSATGDCPMFRRFMKSVTLGDHDLENYLQRVAGYCLTGSTQEEELFFLYGNGANGKGTFMEMLTEAMNSYATVTTTDTFIDKPEGSSHPTSIAKLRGARLVSASETEEGRRWNETKIKEVTGGDKIAARFMRQDEFEFKPQFKLIISGNNKPTLRSVDNAMRRRLNLIPFNLRLGEGERDRGLKERLRTQELPGILRWAVDGALLYLEHGLARPAIVAAATDDYLNAEDAIGMWIEQCCQEGPTLSTPVAYLFASWKNFANLREEYVGTTKRFVSALEKRGLKQSGAGHWRWLNGLALNADEAQETPQEGWWGR